MHHLQPGVGRLLLGLRVRDGQLQPQGPGTDGNGLVGNRRHILALAENIDHVDRGFAGSLQCRCRSGQIGMDGFAQHLLAGQQRVDRHDAVAVLLQVMPDFVAGPVRFVGHADDGDGAVAFQDLADAVGHEVVSLVLMWS